MPDISNRLKRQMRLQQELATVRSGLFLATEVPAFLRVLQTLDAPKRDLDIVEERIAEIRKLQKSNRQTTRKFDTVHRKRVFKPRS